MKKVSIGVLTTGRELASLIKTIQCVEQFEYKNIEIIIVDNGSTDDTQDYFKTHSNYKYFRFEKNQGTSKGRNKIAEISTGDYLFFLDNDILIRDSKIIEKLLTFYNEVEKPGFVILPLVDTENMKTGFFRHYGAYYTFYGIMRNPIVNIKSILDYKETVKVASIFSAAMFFSRELWNNVGKFDESQLFNCDDDDIGTRAMVLGNYNYLYTKSFGEHTGIATRRKGNFEYDEWKYVQYFSGKGRAIIKNFQLNTLLWLFPIFTLATLFMATKWVIDNKYPRYYLSLFKSIKYFISRLPDTLKERKLIQQKRVFSDKVIFSIKCPEYEQRSRLRRLFPF